jgi:riboflavin synthase alpha subunit
MVMSEAPRRVPICPEIRTIRNLVNTSLEWLFAIKSSNDVRNDSFGDSISINGCVVVVTVKNEAALYLGYSVNANNFFNSYFAKKNGPSPLYSIVVFEKKFK